MIQQAIESVSRRESSAPRTILGFLLGMYAALIAASAAVLVALAASDSAHFIPFVLGFDALVTLGLGVAIIVIAWKDPSRLMLGQITAREYANIRRLHLGDDKWGDHPMAVVGSSPLEEKSENDEESPLEDTEPKVHALERGKPNGDDQRGR